MGVELSKDPRVQRALLEKLGVAADLPLGNAMGSTRRALAEGLREDALDALDTPRRRAEERQRAELRSLRARVAELEEELLDAQVPAVAACGAPCAMRHVLHGGAHVRRQTTRPTMATGDLAVRRRRQCHCIASSPLMSLCRVA